VSPSLDAANSTTVKHPFGLLRYGLGAGLHYKSPVGSVNFDLGINPEPRGTEDSYNLHFSIGNI